MAHKHTYFLPDTPRHRESWLPAIDVYQGETGWLVKCDLAGVRREDIRVAVAGRELTVGGARRDWSVTEGMRAYTLEICYSEFERTVELPFDLEAAEIETDYRDGMLLISIATEEE